VLFLDRKYEEALRYLARVAKVDPEDLQMHYTAMLCLSRPPQSGSRRARREAVPPVQGGGSGNRQLRRRGGSSALKTTTSGSRFTNTRAYRSTDSPGSAPLCIPGRRCRRRLNGCRRRPARASQHQRGISDQTDVCHAWRGCGARGDDDGGCAWRHLYRRDVGGGHQVYAQQRQDRQENSCPKHWAPASHSSTRTATACWTFCSSTARTGSRAGVRR